MLAEGDEISRGLKPRGERISKFITRAWITSRVSSIAFRGKNNHRRAPRSHEARRRSGIVGANRVSCAIGLRRRMGALLAARRTERRVSQEGGAVKVVAMDCLTLTTFVGGLIIFCSGGQYET